MLEHGLGVCNPCERWSRSGDYQTDLTPEQWRAVQRVLPAGKAGRRRPTTSLLQVVNAIRYKLRTGCSWRMLPHDFPPWGTVHYYYWSWRQAGVWREVQQALRSRRVAVPRKRAPREEAERQMGQSEPQGP